MNRKRKNLWRTNGGLLCFVDVSGFTPLAEKLAKLGPEGNEYLTELLNRFFGALTEEVSGAGGHILQFGGDALWAYFQNAEAGESACRGMLRRVENLGEHTFGERRYRLRVSLAAARGMELELWRVGPERGHLVLRGDAVAKVSRAEKLVGPGEHAVLHGEAKGTSRAKIAPFLADRPQPPQHQAGLRPTTAVFALLPQSPTPDDLDELVVEAHRMCERYEALLAKIVPLAERQATLILLGTPRAHDDDPRRGVDLALELVRDLELTGAAVASGYVYVGPVGGVSAWEYTAIGDPVNLAARLLDSTGPGQVLVAEETSRLCGADVDFELAWRKRVRGKTGEITAWLALGRSGGLKPARLRYGLIGRKEELARIDSLLERGFGVLYIMGEAGIGKSCLLAEAENRARTAGYRTVAGEVDRMHRDFGLLQSVFENLAGVLDTDTPGSTTEKLDTLFEKELPERPVLDRRRWRTVIGALVFHLETDRRVISGYAPEVLQNSLAEGVTVLVKKLAGDGLFLAFDDLHLADESSLGVLENALGVRGEEDGPVLVATARGEGRFAEAARRPFSALGAEEMALGDLGDDVWGIGDELLDGLPLEDDVRRLILERAQGNPFFLEQLVLDLIERGFIVRRGDRWVAGDGYLPDRLPANVFATILARVDRLHPASAEILRVASVIGQRFDERIIETLLPGKLETLGEAESTGLAVRDEKEELAYLFRHTLVREVTYRSLLVEQRKKLHHDVARAMIDLNEPPGEIAVHLERAERTAEAAEYHLKSAEAKKDYGSYSPAEGEARRSLELALEIDDPVLANGARLALADILTQLGRSGESLLLLEEAYAGSQELGDDHLAVKVCRLAVMSLIRLGRAAEINCWIKRAEEAAADDLFLRISIAPIRCYPYMFAQRYPEALRIVEEAARLFPDPVTDEEVRAMAIVHGNLGMLYTYTRELKNAELSLRRALELAEGTGDRSLVLDYRLNLSVLLTEQERFAEARSIQLKCIDEYEEMGYHQGHSTALYNLAQIEWELGEEDRAVEDLEKSLSIARRIRNAHRTARTASVLAYCLARRGRLEGARELADESVRLYEEHRFDNKVGLVYAIHAYLDACAGDAESAKRYLGLAEGCPAVDSRPSLDEVVSRTKAELGEPDDA
jgi:class 3 adenylate cyclase/tetratricopeptide (TPR) repeat protein